MNFEKLRIEKMLYIPKEHPHTTFLVVEISSTSMDVYLHNGSKIHMNREISIYHKRVALLMDDLKDMLNTS